LGEGGRWRGAEERHGSMNRMTTDVGQALLGFSAADQVIALITRTSQNKPRSARRLIVSAM
jgi:hypothetical protein